MSFAETPTIKNFLPIRFLLTTLLCSAAATITPALAAAGARDTANTGAKPNVLFIVLDDVGWRDTSCYGRTEWATPNIDRIAANGCRFTRAYAMPLCSPTRSMFLSGKHCVRFGITDWIKGFPPPEDSLWQTPKMTAGLPTEEVTFAEAFAAAGYVTYQVGKWHVGNVPPEEQGFKHVAETGQPHWDKESKRYTEAPKVDAAIRFMKESRPSPFLMYLGFSSVHLPIMATPEKEAKHAGAPNPTYAAMVDHVDEYVGQLMAALQELDLAKNTLVIVTSDNGGVGRCNFNAKPFTNNLPLRGNKGSLYEGGVRVPLIVSHPGRIMAGSVSDAFIGPADFYPTLLDHCGLPLRPEQHTDGVSFAGVFRGEPGKRRALQWHYPHFSRHTMGFPSGAIHRDEWKLIEWFGQTGENGKNRVELFNLAEDAGEQNDLADHFPKIRDALLQELAVWRTETGAVMPTRRTASN